MNKKVNQKFKIVSRYHFFLHETNRAQDKSGLSLKRALFCLSFRYSNIFNMHKRSFLVILVKFTGRANPNFSGLLV